MSKSSIPTHMTIESKREGIMIGDMERIPSNSTKLLTQRSRLDLNR